MRNLSILLFILPVFAFAKVHTVDNTPGNGAMFTSLQTAISSASSGDTIIVMRSIDGYGSTSIQKKLFLYSDGHHHPSIFKDRRVLISGLSLGSGSDNSIISGFYFSNTTVSIGAKNIQLNCNFFNAAPIVFAGGGVSGNCTLEGNIFWFPGTQNAFQISLSNSANNLIKNNWYSIMAIYPGYTYEASNGGYIDGGNSTNLFVNNLLTESNSGWRNTSTFFRNSSMNIHNNILRSNVADRTRFDTLSGSPSFKNNITYSSTRKVKNLPGTNNINNTAPEFETSFSGSNPPTMDLSYNLRLKSSSVGKNGGTDSTDIGLFGGGYFFSITGNVKSVPIFDDFYIVTPVVKRNGKLKVKLVARKPEN